ncbi:MAG: hypothetical protein D6731_25895 [Planctomycetota bacterium]|nr:MAG: hypothetical protein D6731_25895 [Planctomycetota bacterium]
MKLWHAVPILLALLGGAAWAQGGPGGPPRRPTPSEEEGLRRGDALLAGWTDLDPALLGTTWLGLYLPGGESVGRVRIDVERAPADSGAAYAARYELRMTFAGSTLTRSGSSLHDTDLGVLESSERALARKGDEEERQEYSLRREGDRWVYTARKGERELHSTLPCSAVGGRRSLHQGLVCTLLLGRKLARGRGESFALRTVDWPELTEAGPEASGEARPSKVAVMVLPPTKVEHRGRSLEGVRVHFASVRKGIQEVVADAEGRLLSFRSRTQPIRMVAASSEKECLADLGKRPAIEPGPQSPLGACALYLLVLAHARPVGDLDQVMDWEAILRRFRAREPRRWADHDAARLRKELLRDFQRAETGLRKEHVDRFLPLLEAEVRDRKATVRGPGLAPFELVQQEDGTWRIVRFPS